jgi:hypothetical protein
LRDVQSLLAVKKTRDPFADACPELRRRRRRRRIAQPCGRRTRPNFGSIKVNRTHFPTQCGENL